MTRAAAILVAGLLSLLSWPVLASVTYEFSGTAPSKYEPSVGHSFTFTTDDFITAPLSVAASSLDSCSVTSPANEWSCAEVDFGPASAGLAFDTIMFTAWGAGQSYGWEYVFAAGALSTPGTHSFVPFGELGPTSGQLTVSVPEPTSLALLTIGFSALGASRLRRKLRT